MENKNPSISDIQKAYEDAMKGQEQPNIAGYYCSECRRGFFFSRFGGGDQPCEHLLKIRDKNKDKAGF